MTDLTGLDGINMSINELNSFFFLPASWVMSTTKKSVNQNIKLVWPNEDI